MLPIVSQSATDKTAKGRVTLGEVASHPSITIDTLGAMQTTKGWASFTGIARTATGDARAVTVIVDEHDPAAPGSVTVVVMLKGAPPWSGTMTPTGVSIK